MQYGVSFLQRHGIVWPAYPRRAFCVIRCGKLYLAPASFAWGGGVATGADVSEMSGRRRRTSFDNRLSTKVRGGDASDGDLPAKYFVFHGSELALARRF